MPRYRFSWDAFADEVVEAFAESLGYHPDEFEGSPRAFLEEVVQRPNPTFVQHHKDLILDAWVAGHEETARYPVTKTDYRIWWRIRRSPEVAVPEEGQPVSGAHEPGETSRPLAPIWLWFHNRTCSLSLDVPSMAHGWFPLEIAWCERIVS
ncbi:MAG: hypothetical protein RLP09_30610 [Sandaracinaceae bacterium]